MNHIANVYPHHDLLNLAYYHLEEIQRKDAEKIIEAKGLDCMSCLIALAIGVEGLINFCGLKLVPNWKEREKYHIKLKQVTESLEIELDESIDPFKTLAQLKYLRDELAHPKPITREKKVKSHDEFNKLMETAWDKFCNSKYVHHAYEQVTLFEQIIYSNPSIQKSDILTSAWGWGDFGV